MQLASYYKLNNLIGIIDVNRLGQRGETMLGYNIKEYQKRVSAFGWEVFLIDDGHDLSKIIFSNIKFVGSHAGVSIGADGASQMGLEDIAMFRTILNGAVLYPSDAVSCEKLVQDAASYQGIVYIRTTRAETSVLYSQEDNFKIGGSYVVKSSQNDIVTIIAAGITLHEALAAYQELAREGIFIRVIDCYSIKPIDQKILKQAAEETKAIITVEDHFAEGGLGEAVASALSDNQIPVRVMAVRKMPKSGKMRELLDYEEISKDAIIKKVKSVLNIL